LIAFDQPAIANRIRGLQKRERTGWSLNNPGPFFARKEALPGAAER